MKWPYQDFVINICFQVYKPDIFEPIFEFLRYNFILKIKADYPRATTWTWHWSFLYHMWSWAKNKWMFN